MAPSTRFVVGEAFCQPMTKNCSGDIIQILKEKFSFALVYDVNVGADMTTLIDTEELLELKKQGKTMFTSCCPAWINLMEMQFPQLIP